MLLYEEIVEKSLHLCENRLTAQPRYEVTGSAAAPCSPACRARSRSRPVFRFDLHDSLLFRWLIRLSPDHPICHPTTFTSPSAAGRSWRSHWKRDRLLNEQVMGEVPQEDGAGDGAPPAAPSLGCAAGCIAHLAATAGPAG